jgi:hypothetical protein
MRPVHYRRASAIVHHFPGDFDAVSDLNRAAWSDRNVVDDFDRPGGALRVERLVYAMRARTVKVTRRRGNRRLEVDA